MKLHTLSTRTERDLAAFHEAREKRTTVKLLWLLAVALIALGFAIYLPR